MSRSSSPAAATSRLILQIGQAGRDELSPAAVELATLCTAARWTLETVSADALLRRLEGPIPELVVVLERWPDEFTRPEVEALLARWPLARLVCVSGPWCDSAGRTRDIWPTAVRVPALEARERLCRECEALAAFTPPPPVTSSRTEAFAGWYLEPAPPSPAGAGTRRDEPLSGSATLRIISPDPDYAAALADLCRAWPEPAGRLPDGADHTPPREVILWDVDAVIEGREEDDLSRLAAALEGLRGGRGEQAVIALVGFPRLAHLTTLEQRPNVRVVSKLAGAKSLRRAIAALTLRRDA